MDGNSQRVNRSMPTRSEISTLMTNSNGEDEKEYESNFRGSTAHSTSSAATTARQKESDASSSLSIQMSRTSAVISRSPSFVNAEPINKSILNRGVGETLLASITDTIPSIQDEVEVESTEHLSLERQLEMLRGKLARRNALIEEIRRSYYSDVIVIKDELRNRDKECQHCSSHSSIPIVASGIASTTTVARSTNEAEDLLKGIPSIDLRKVLPLFAPEENSLQIHPCDKCGGTIELIHGESKELSAARQEMQRAVKAETGMKALVHRMRTEAKMNAELTEALEQRVRALVKENAYTLEQLQTSRKAEREQKTIIANLRSKLQLAHATQDENDRLSVEYKECQQQLLYSNRERDIYSASNIHLKDELSEVTKNLHQLKVDMVQVESNYGETYNKLQEELKKTKQLSEELSFVKKELEDKKVLLVGLQTSNTSLKEELASGLQRFDEIKRHLEDQLVEEERSREEIQEQASELKRQNRKLLKEIEAMKKMNETTAASQNSGTEGKNKHLKDDDTCLSGRSGATVAVASSQELGYTMSQSAEAQNENYSEPRSGMQTGYSSELDVELPVDFGLRAHNKQGKYSNMNSSQAQRPVSVPPGRFAGNPNITRGQFGNSNITRGQLHINGVGTNKSGASSVVNPPGPVDLDSPSIPIENEMELQFEGYLKETHQKQTEITELKAKNAKGDQRIVELEKKQQITQDRLDEARTKIELLNTTIDSLNARLNQDRADAAETIQEMFGQIEQIKKELQVETQMTNVLNQLIVKVSTYLHGLCQNVSLLVPIELEKIPEANTLANSSKADDNNPSISVGDVGVKKKELTQKKILLEKAFKVFEQLTHTRAELIICEITNLLKEADSIKKGLYEAENKAEKENMTIHSLEEEIDRYQLIEEKHLYKIASQENALKNLNDECIILKQKMKKTIQELENSKKNVEQIRDESKKILLKFTEKTKALEKEISFNEYHTKRIANLEQELENIKSHREEIQLKLQAIENQEEYRKQTNRNVEISAIPEMVDSCIQTDRWRPHGLELRQRNAPEKIPQRYMGKTSVFITSNEFEKIGISRPVTSINQESIGLIRPITSVGRVDTQESHVIELDLYPSSRVGGRQIKIYQGSRPRALSKIVLSSDALSKRFVSPLGLPVPHEGFQDGIPFD